MATVMAAKQLWLSVRDDLTASLTLRDSTVRAALVQIAAEKKNTWPKQLREEDVPQWCKTMSQRLRQQGRFLNQASSGYGFAWAYM
eukprot:15024802-Alexandrium_andersonii.AAC.1